MYRSIKRIWTAVSKDQQHLLTLSHVPHSAPYLMSQGANMELGHAVQITASCFSSSCKIGIVRVTLLIVLE